MGTPGKSLAKNRKTFEPALPLSKSELAHRAEKEGEVVPCDDLPKSFVLTSEYGFHKVRLTSLSSATLEKRLK